MPMLAPTKASFSNGHLDSLLSDAASGEATLAETLHDIEALVAPLWPLKDYVAVNPFLGLSQHKFLVARQMLRRVRDCELLPTSEYFRAQLRDGQISRADLERALRECLQEYPTLYAGWQVDQIESRLECQSPLPEAAERRYFTIAEIVDLRQQSTWSSHIVNDITRHCAAHYDEGQAAWPNPWKELSLYQAWREAALLSWRMDYLGVKGFQNLVRELPATPLKAIDWMLQELNVPPMHRHGFLLCQILSVAGWASYAKYRAREAEMSGSRGEDLIGLLAIRLAYDVALAQAHANQRQSVYNLLVAEAVSRDAIDHFELAPPLEVLARYAMQVAKESAYRRELKSQLVARLPSPRSVPRKTAQLVFCIDVRSEVMRRHLEAQTDRLETFGFAGFFGLAFEYDRLGESSGAAQCPVLLKPGIRLRETVLGAEKNACDSAINARRARHVWRKLWKSFQTSAVSCFSFVESLGLVYFGKLLADSLRLKRTPRGNLPVLGPELDHHGKFGLCPASQVDLAEKMLRNLGLTENFARIVTICGHASEVVNNPYKAGLDCGACGGHSGEPNARVAAALLNDERVRAGLQARGLHVPEDTFFLPAVHNTTTDEIRLLDTFDLPASHLEELEQLKRWIREAGMLCRVERSQRMNGATAQDLLRRSQDWSEVRPEWGLAGNASFVVAPRSRTAGLNLGGRTFMHSYDPDKDPQLAVLELIMTAPMIVTSWINLQYYASTVDNRAFGSGNKVIHNVVGQLGVLQGNGGDLMTGLPWQSVHDGVRFQHEPLRLLVVIEASRDAVQQIIDQHNQVRDLLTNGWISLAVLEDQRWYRRNSADSWEEEELTSDSSALVDAAPRSGSTW